KSPEPSQGRASVLLRCLAAGPSFPTERRGTEGEYVERTEHMRRLLLTLGLAGACASGLFSTGVAAAVPDGPLGMRAAVSESQQIAEAVGGSRGPWGNRRCFRTGGRAFGSASWGRPWDRRWDRRWRGWR